MSLWGYKKYRPYFIYSAQEVQGVHSGIELRVGEAREKVQGSVSLGLLRFSNVDPE